MKLDGVAGVMRCSFLETTPTASRACLHSCLPRYTAKAPIGSLGSLST